MTLNGQLRTMYFITTFATGVLRIPNLGIQNGSGDGDILCIGARAGHGCGGSGTAGQGVTCTGLAMQVSVRRAAVCAPGTPWQCGPAGITAVESLR